MLFELPGTSKEKLSALIFMFMISLFEHEKTFTSSYLRCSVRKTVLRKFAKFPGKHLCQSLFK